MNNILISFLLLTFVNLGFAKDTKICSQWPSWAQKACLLIHEIWTAGDNELYLSGYAWHNRFTYPRHKIKQYNELAWGGGLGKGLYDQEGDWHGLFAIAFLDSHRNIEPAAGYAFLKVAHFNKRNHIGIGYAVLATARPDVFHNIPFVGIIPWISIRHQKVSFSATYIPGAKGAGNVLYVIAKVKFDLF